MCSKTLNILSCLLFLLMSHCAVSVLSYIFVSHVTVHYVVVIPVQFSPPVLLHCKEKCFTTSSVTSKQSRLLFGLIVKVVTWVELPRSRCTADLGTRVSSWVHRGVVATGKTSPTLKLNPHSSPHLLPFYLPVNPHLPPPPPLPSSPLQACAPLYSWRTEKDIPRSDATGTCYLSARNFTKFVEYAPCRTGKCQSRWCCLFIRCPSGKLSRAVQSPWNQELRLFIKHLLHQIIHGATSLCFRDQWCGGTRLLSGRIQRWLHNGNNHLPV